MSNENAFEKACSVVQKNNPRINQADLLKLYSYYKQAMEGDVKGKRPGITNLRGRAKYDGWATLKGTRQAEAKDHYIRLVSNLDFIEKQQNSFEEKHSAAKEMLNRELDELEYQEIKDLWKAHSIAEDNRDIDGLMATLTEDCRYEIPQIGKTYYDKTGATQFYHDLLGAFPDIDFRLTQIYIGPQGVVEAVSYTHLTLPTKA